MRPPRWCTSMPDIFVSYAREDHEWVGLFTRRLREAGGWDIWWDLRLLPGEQFDNVIEHTLDQARCVIVIWSQHSVGSRWVRSEAREGALRGTLVPLSIGGVRPPLEFQSFETPDMSTWRGDAANTDFTEIVHVVRQAIDRTPAAVGANVSLGGGGAASAAPADIGRSRRSAARVDVAVRDRPVPSRSVYLWAGGVAAATLLVILAVGIATREGALRDPGATRPSAEAATPQSVAALGPQSSPEPAVAPPVEAPRKPGPSTEATASRPADVPRTPQFPAGTWTLRDAIDDTGTDWSNSTIKFTSQEPTSDGLTLKGTMTWRVGETFVGTEEFSGRYFDAGRQLFLEGQSVSAAKILAIGSYSAILSSDERSLLKGTWGSTASPTGLPGVPGRWEASR